MCRDDRVHGREGWDSHGNPHDWWERRAAAPSAASDCVRASVRDRNCLLHGQVVLRPDAVNSVACSHRSTLHRPMAAETPDRPVWRHLPGQPRSHTRLRLSGAFNSRRTVPHRPPSRRSGGEPHRHNRPPRSNESELPGARRVLAYGQRQQLARNRSLEGDACDHDSVQVPAEVDLDLAHLIAAERHHLGVAKALAVGARAFVGHEHVVAGLDQALELEPAELRGVGQSISGRSWSS